LNKGWFAKTLKKYTTSCCSFIGCQLLT